MHDGTKIEKSSSTDTALVSYAHTVCKSFDQGATWDQIIGTVTREQKISAHDWGFVTGAAVRVYCPQHSLRLPDSQG